MSNSYINTTYGIVNSNWPIHKFIDYVFFQEGPGLRKWQWTDSGMKVINVTNILSDGTIDVNNTDRYISLNEFNNKYKHFAIDNSDVVIASSGNTYGKVGRIKSEHLPVMMNTSVIRLRPLHNNHLDPEYLYAFLRCPFFKNQIEAYVIGSAQPNFGPSHLKLMDIIIPPFQVQQKIGAVISAYDELIENNTRRIKIIEEMAQNLYREWFVKFRFPGHEEVKMVESELGMIPEGWEQNKLGDISQEVRRNISPCKIEPDTPYFGLEHLPRKSIALADWGKASEVQSTKLSFNKGEILFGKIRPYFHKVGVAPVNGICSTDAIVIVPKKPEWFGITLSCVSSEAFVSHASQTSQGTKMPRANWDILVKFPILLPPEPILAEFNNHIDSAVKLINILLMKNRNLSRTRDLLLPKLISGELDVENLDIDIGVAT